MDRMNPLDSTFLHVEDGVTHMDIASCAVFEGPPPPYDQLVELYRSKLPLVPRYRQKVRFVPGSLGRPVWVDDPHFRLDYHVRHTALPPPGSDADLRNLMGRLMSQQLDHNRPLWEAWMVEGLADGSWAVISKIHHCMVDGVSGTDLMAVVLDSSPEVSAPVADDWAPRPEPSDVELVVSALADLARSPFELTRWIQSSFHGPRRMAAGIADFVQGARSLSRTLVPNVELSIEGNIGPHRRWTWATATFDEVKEVRQAFGGTMNDVVLAVCTQGFRDLLLHRGDEVDGVVLRTLVPVSVRSPGDTTPNNQVAAIIAELPVGIADPVERLEVIKAQMAGLKQSHQAEAGTLLTNAAAYAPAALVSFGLRTATTMLRSAPQRNVNTVTTNVPGPKQALYACGRQMIGYYPFVPLSQGVRTGVAIVSYDGRLAFGVTGDWDTVPDVDVLAKGIEAGMRELRAAAKKATAKPVAPAPRRSKPAVKKSA